MLIAWLVRARMACNRVALLDDFGKRNRDFLVLRTAGACIESVNRLGACHQRQHMRVGQYAWEKIGMRVRRENVVRLLDAPYHRANDMTQQRRHAFQFFFDDTACDSRQLTKAQCLGGVRSRLGRQQRRFAEKLALAERGENDLFFIALRGDFDFAICNDVDDCVAQEAFRIDDFPRSRGASPWRALLVHDYYPR